MLKLNRTDVENLTLFKRGKRKLISVSTIFAIHSKAQIAAIFLFLFFGNYQEQISTLLHFLLFQVFLSSMKCTIIFIQWFGIATLHQLNTNK